jgi:ankyrin repeat protein
MSIYESYAVERFPILSVYKGGNKRDLIWRRGAVVVAEGILADDIEKLQHAQPSDVIKRKRIVDIAQENLNTKRRQLAEAEEFFGTDMDMMEKTYNNRAKLTDVLTIMACSGYANEATFASNITREFSRFIPTMSSEEEGANYRSSLYWHNVINVRDGTGATRLIWAVKTNNIALVKDLILWKADLNLKDFRGRNALWYSIFGRFTDITKILLDNININDDQGFMPLHFSMANFNIEASNLLIDKGIDLNTLDNNMSALYICYSRYSSGLILLKNSFLSLFDRIINPDNINIKSESGEMTVLMQASAAGDLFMVKKLVQAGADITLRSSRGSTAFDCINMFFQVQSRKTINKLRSLLQF